MSELRAIRKKRGLTEEHLAYIAGVDTATISRFENGLVTPKPETVVAIARALGVSIKRIVKETRVPVAHITTTEGTNDAASID